MEVFQNEKGSGESPEPFKTDGTDAALLAEYGECMKPAWWQAPEETLMNLRDLGRQINRLTPLTPETKWCGQLTELRERARQAGSEIIIDMAAKPVKWR